MARFLFYAAASVAVASLAAADTVLLTSGKRMEDVVASVGEGGVTIRYSYGEMTLPASMVVRVEREESSLERYLARSAELRADRSAGAADWLDLALAARTDGLDDGYRRALQRAAALDPHWPALAPAMRELGFVVENDRWIPFEQSVEGRALRAGREAQRRAELAAAVELRRSERRHELVQSLELALLAQLVEEAAEAASEPAPQQGIPLWSHGYGPTVVYSPHGVAPGWRDTPANRATLRDLSRRQPGSLLPVTPHRRPAPRPVAPPRAPVRRQSSFKSPSGG